MTLKKNLTFAGIISAIFVTAFIIATFQGDYKAKASVNITQEYTATSTAPNTAYGATITASTLIRTGQGSLGSIVITGANTGVVNIYNATTTSVLKRTTSTSSILIASIPASAAAGTYVFDSQYTDGLYIDLVSGNMPTSTVTYR